MTARAAVAVGTLAVVLPAAPAASAEETVVPLPRHQAALERLVQQVSDPGSLRYRHYLSLAQVSRRYGASAGARQRVRARFRARGARVSVDPTGAFAVVRRPGPPRPASAAQTDTPPPTVVGPAVRTGSPAGCAGGVASGGFTPNQIVDAYGVRPLHRRGIQGQGTRIALLQATPMVRSDVDRFSRCFGLGKPRMRILPAVPGGPSPPDVVPAGEARLDVEVAHSIAPRAALDVYVVGTQSLPDFPRLFSAPLDPKRNGGHPPDVIMRSSGGCELAWVQTGPEELALMEHILMVAAATGVTVLASAGDRGSSDCQAADSPDPVPPAVTRYPASSRYVTGIGGTALQLDTANQIVAQPVWNDLPFGRVRGGGGGRSRIFPRPRWQVGHGVPTLRRSVPDVSFLADLQTGYAFYCTSGCRNGVGWQTTGGTSAGTPLMAGGVALSDQVAKARDRPRLGLINPLLYRLALHRKTRRRVFHDVARGNNDLLGVGCCEARRGYDLASGLGSVDIGAFAAAASP